VSDSAGALVGLRLVPAEVKIARRGIRTPDRLIKRISLYKTSRFACDLRSDSPFDSTRTALQERFTTVSQYDESPIQVRAIDCCPRKLV